jgi:hypothetical protein
MQWQALGAHLWQDRQTSTVYYTGHDPKRVHVPHTVFQPSRDALQARWVEERVVNRGLRTAYLDALIHELNVEHHVVEAALHTGYPSAEYAPPIVRAIIDATPAQRCRAAVNVSTDGGASYVDHASE